LTRLTVVRLLLLLLLLLLQILRGLEENVSMDT
jgi:hypothetical protein